ncbi:MAG: efflux RND transporter permease subunit, partial [Magnetococcales bacterium]|nr:efflux RND transporter permease subunit [Magnetococcales bacterium]
MKREKVNWSGRLAGLFIDSRLTPLLVLAVLLFGLVGLAFTPREENPSIVVPAVEVKIPFPGAMPSEVEHLLLSPLEGELMAIDGVKNVYGAAQDGLAQVTVEFDVGQNREKSLVRLYDRVLGYALPPGAGPATVHNMDVDDVPVFAVTLASDQFDDFQLRRMAERVMDRLRSVQGVGRGIVVGGRGREIRVEVIPERLQGFGLIWSDVAMALQTADFSQPLTARVYDGENRSIRLVARVTHVDQVAQIVVGRHNGGIVRIQDVAGVIDGPPLEQSSFTRFSFGPADSRFARNAGTEMAAVTVAMAKQRGTNAVEVTRQLRQRISSMEEGFLPPGVHVVVTRDDGAKADRAVTGLVMHLFVAIGAVGVVLWFFLGVRTTLIVAITIPMVFAVVMGMDLLFGPTLNRITLYALILALGMLVDDAIVVAENTHRHFLALELDDGTEKKSEAAILAVHEIGNPTTLATFTVVAVFLSLILVSGMLGEYFLPIAFNVPVSMVASLIIAYTVTPWLACRFLKSGRYSGDAANSKLQSLYRTGMIHLLRNRTTRHGFYFAVFFLLTLSILQPAWQFIRPQGVAGEVSPLGVPLAFLPKDNKNTFLIHIHLPETTPLEVTDRAVRGVEALLRQMPQVKDYQSHVGYPAVIDFNGLLKGSSSNVGPQFAEIRVNLVDKESRDQTSIDLVRRLRESVGKIANHFPGGIIQLVE